jgi:CHASE3 domain sensor protein
MADTQLSVGKTEELKSRLQNVKRIEEERIAALESLKQELEQREKESCEDDAEEDSQRMVQDGQAMVEQLDRRIKAMQREMQDKKRSQELRKRQLMDEREEIVKQIAAEVEEMKARSAEASNSRSAYGLASVICISLAVLCGAAFYVWQETPAKLRLPLLS